MYHSVTPWTAACQASLPSPSPGVCSSSCPLHWWYHPAISSSDALFCPQSFPASGTFPMSQLFISGDHNTGVSVSASVLKIDWFDILAIQGTFRSLLQHHSLKASILWCSSFFIVQLSQLSVTMGKTISLTIQTFVSRVMSLLFNTLSRFVITFLPRSKHLLISWLQSPSAVIWSSRRGNLSLLPLFPFYLPCTNGARCHDLSFLNI